MRCKSMKDFNGVDVLPGDFVQLTQGKESYINNAMRKGFVFKVSYIEDRTFGGESFKVAFLTDKKTGTRIYNSGCTSDEIKKVEYDIKKRRIIK